MLRGQYVAGFPLMPVSSASPPTEPLEPVLGELVDNSSDTEDKIAASVGIPLDNDGGAARSTPKKKKNKSDKKKNNKSDDIISDFSSSDDESISYSGSSGDEDDIDVVGSDDESAAAAASDQPPNGDEGLSSSSESDSTKRRNKKRSRTRKTHSSSSSESEYVDDELVSKKSRRETRKRKASESDEDDQPVSKKARLEEQELLDAAQGTKFELYARTMFLPGESQPVRQLATVKGGILGTWSDVFDALQQDYSLWAQRNGGDLFSFTDCTNRTQKQKKILDNRWMFLDFLKSIKHPQESVLAREQREVLAQRSAKPKSSHEKTKTRRSAKPKIPASRESSAKLKVPASHESDGKEVESGSKSRTDKHAGSEDEHFGLEDEKDAPQVPKKAGTYDLDSTLKTAILFATFKIWKHSQRFGKQLTREDLAEIMNSSVVHSSGDSADSGAVEMRKCLPDQPHVSVDFRFWDFHYASQWTQVAAAIEAHVINGSNEALEQLELPAEKLANWIVFAMAYYPEGKYKIPEIPSVDEFDFGSMFP